MQKSWNLTKITIMNWYCVSNLNISWSYLKTSKTRPAWYPGQSDIADIRRSWTGYWFINDQGSIFEICSTSRQFHLPKFLECFHYVDWKENQKWPAWVFEIIAKGSKESSRLWACCSTEIENAWIFRL